MAMLNVLRKRYDDETLEVLLLTAKERSSSTISELRNELWLSQGKTVGQAYFLLQLDTLGEHVLFSPDLGPLVSYANKVRGKYVTVSEGVHERSWLTLRGEQRRTGVTDGKIANSECEARSCAEGHRSNARAAHSSRTNRWLRASEASDGLFAGEGSLGNLPDSEH
ncbi:hypothetical protein PHYSODRAFT_330046 [Phytophthora sojae]|uniref:Uncharacterized protein n=1 Tax=Phytophthora sojae (strain P6497) TaxID=1094619 RepID=G4Z2T4_PHYSP|nr:hypothetical protein PHYSODRAFT_330046 [Phytophthora sojae]EGZ22209.1 hypothetical protein PHYSODRAFT_330046 [Phytophthora sojae]|eukprot:XP_009524926.1 hypothetical protein PHYSODRAFT_330046 [Phytophthora sojae]